MYLGGTFVRKVGCMEDDKTRCLKAAQVFFTDFPLYLGTKKSA